MSDVFCTFCGRPGQHDHRGERVMQLCEHYACRCARAAELAAIADRTGNGVYLREAIEVHSQLVRCRMSA